MKSVENKQFFELIHDLVQLLKCESPLNYELLSALPSDTWEWTFHHQHKVQQSLVDYFHWNGWTLQWRFKVSPKYETQDLSRLRFYRCSSAKNATPQLCKEHTSYLSFFSYMQNFWRIKSTPKYTVNYCVLLCKTVNYCVLYSKYTVNCQFFALNL